MFIKELGIKKIAEKTVRNIAEKFDSIDDFLSATSDLENLKDRLSKKIIPRSVYDYFRNANNNRVIDELLAAKVQPTAPKQKVSDMLAEQTIVVTGTLSHFTRQQIEQTIKDHGGKVSSSVSKKTSFVLAGDDAGSKLDKARQLQIKVTGENEFLQLIKKKPPEKRS
jgi:DNA ligase (NAD+)